MRAKAAAPRTPPRKRPPAERPPAEVAEGEGLEDVPPPVRQRLEPKTLERGMIVLFDGERRGWVDTTFPGLDECWVCQEDTRQLVPSAERDAPGCDVRTFHKADLTFAGEWSMEVEFEEMVEASDEVIERLRSESGWEARWCAETGITVQIVPPSADGTPGKVVVGPGFPPDVKKAKVVVEKALQALVPGQPGNGKELGDQVKAPQTPPLGGGEEEDAPMLEDDSNEPGTPEGAKANSKKPTVSTKPKSAAFGNVRTKAKPKVTRYLVDNSLRKADSMGCAYRNSMTFADFAQQGAPWGSEVMGIDQGNGWIRVGTFFLPMTSDGVQILVPLDEAEHEEEVPGAAGAGDVPHDEGSQSHGHAAHSGMPLPQTAAAHVNAPSLRPVRQVAPGGGLENRNRSTTDAAAEMPASKHVENNNRDGSPQALDGRKDRSTRLPLWARLQKAQDALAGQPGEEELDAQPRPGDRTAPQAQLQPASEIASPDKLVSQPGDPDFANSPPQPVTPPQPHPVELLKAEVERLAFQRGWEAAMEAASKGKGTGSGPSDEDEQGEQVGAQSSEDGGAHAEMKGAQNDGQADPAAGAADIADHTAQDASDSAEGSRSSILNATLTRPEDAREGVPAAAAPQDEDMAAAPATQPSNPRESDPAGEANNQPKQSDVSDMADMADGKQGLTVQYWAENQQQFAQLPKLPENWIRIRSNGTGRVYYVNTMTGKSTFVEPDELPAGWTRCVSRSTGKAYYFNVLQNRSVFDRPTA